MNIKEIYPYILSPYTIIISIISLIYIFREKISDYLLHQLIVLLHKYQKKRRPKRIILVRHGNSEANNNYDILKNIPDNKVHLSEKGISQAKAAGKKT